VFGGEAGRSTALADRVGARTFRVSLIDTWVTSAALLVSNPRSDGARQSRPPSRSTASLASRRSAPVASR
jgi:hypothetical protein